MIDETKETFSVLARIRDEQGIFKKNHSTIGSTLECMLEVECLIKQLRTQRNRLAEIAITLAGGHFNECPAAWESKCVCECRKIGEKELEAILKGVGSER